jgi:outer membrane protein OmpA-like peptidoglycan-associated protein
MEKLILTNLKVTDDDLKALSEERAKAVRNYLLQSQQVEETRIFIVESKALDVKDKEGAKKSRTDFKLK